MTAALPRTAGTVTTAEGPSCDSRCLGVDIGGTNIKSAVVDASHGALITLGTGTGSALIVNGHLSRRRHHQSAPDHVWKKDLS